MGCCSQRSGMEKILLVVLGIFSVTAITVGVVFGVKESNKSEPTNLKENVCTTKECAIVAGQILSKMDLTADPCEDPVQFACGRFLDETEIPETVSRWTSFSIAGQRVTNILHKIMESGARSEDPDAVHNMMALYQSCIDTEFIEVEGYSFFVDTIVNNDQGGLPVIIGDTYDPSKFHLAEALGDSARLYGSSAIVSVGVMQDSFNSSQHLIHIDQPSLGLPKKMFEEPENYIKVLDAYKTFAVDVLKLLAAESKKTPPSDDQLNQAWEDMLKMETTLAENSTPDEDRRNITALYNPMTLQEVKDNWPEIGFEVYFERLFSDTGIVLNDEMTIIVVEPAYFTFLNTMLKDNMFKKETIANYIFLNLASRFSSRGPKKLRDIVFEFQTVLSGVKHEPPRWKTCVGSASSDYAGYGMAAGYSYVTAKFDEDAKADVNQMVENLRAAFISLVEKLDWMDDETKAKAQEKAESIVHNIAYPDWLIQEGELDKYYEEAGTMEKKKYLNNVLTLTKWKQKKHLSRLNEKPDPTEWSMNSAVVNAWYQPSQNTITFPAAILQQPFYNSGIPKYVNYGGIGAVIGHEITHGFDDQGKQYDKDGNVNLWWTPETAEEFDVRAQCFVDMYENYTVPELIPIIGIENAHLNGKNTQGENIADNGGLKEAFKAYANYVTKNLGGIPEEKLPGLQEYSSEQMLSISFSQVWCEKSTDEALLNQVLADPHSPGKYRILGPLSNSKDFAKHFNCPEGSAMNRPNKCELW